MTTISEVRDKRGSFKALFHLPFKCVGKCTTVHFVDKLSDSRIHNAALRTREGFVEGKSNSEGVLMRKSLKGYRISVRNNLAFSYYHYELEAYRSLHAFESHLVSISFINFACYISNDSESYKM